VATYRLLRAIAEFDRREAWGFQSTAHWLAWRQREERYLDMCMVCHCPQEFPSESQQG